MNHVPNQPILQMQNILCSHIGHASTITSYGVFRYSHADDTLHEANRSVCVNLTPQKLEMLLYVQLTAFNFIGYLVPLTLVTVLYIFVWRFSFAQRGADSSLVRNASSITANGETAAGRPTGVIRQRTKVTRLIAVIILAYAVCWLPVHIVFPVKTYLRPRTFYLFIQLQAPSSFS